MIFWSKGALKLESDARVSGRMTEAWSPCGTREVRRRRPRHGVQDLQKEPRACSSSIANEPVRAKPEGGASHGGFISSFRGRTARCLTREGRNPRLHAMWAGRVLDGGGLAPGLWEETELRGLPPGARTARLRVVRARHRLRNREAPEKPRLAPPTARRHHGCESESRFASARAFGGFTTAGRPAREHGVNEDRASGGLRHPGRDATQPHALHGPEARFPSRPSSVVPELANPVCKFF
jgi:hypothetical protein